MSYYSNEHANTSNGYIYVRCSNDNPNTHEITQKSINFQSRQSNKLQTQSRVSDNHVTQEDARNESMCGKI